MFMRNQDNSPSSYYDMIDLTLTKEKLKTVKQEIVAVDEKILSGLKHSLAIKENQRDASDETSSSQESYSAFSQQLDALNKKLEALEVEESLLEKRITHLREAKKITVTLYHQFNLVLAPHINDDLAFFTFRPRNENDIRFINFINGYLSVTLKNCHFREVSTNQSVSFSLPLDHLTTGHAIISKLTPYKEMPNQDQPVETLRSTTP